MFWFYVYCALAGLNGHLCRGLGRRAWSLLWPQRLARALFEWPWARLCGLRVRRWSPPGKASVLVVPRRANRVHQVGQWLLAPLFTLLLCGLLAGFLELPFETLEAGLGWAGATDSARRALELGPRLAPLSAVFGGVCLLLLPLSCLELPSAALLFGLGLGLRFVVETLDALGLHWRTFSDGWFVHWFYGSALNEWLAGFFLVAALTCVLSAVLLLVARSLGRD